MVWGSWNPFKGRANGKRSPELPSGESTSLQVPSPAGEKSAVGVEANVSLVRADRLPTARLVYEALELGVEYAYGCAVLGDIAEFGTMSGSTAVILAKAMKELSERYREANVMHNIGERKLFLFDSFQGLPQTSNVIDTMSPHVASKVWGPGVARGLTAAELHTACAQVLGSANVRVIPGWYNETLPKLSRELRFALVSIDCDLYESTSAVLEFLLGQKTYSDGCAVFFDDWYCNRGSPQFGEQRAWAESIRKYNVQFTDWGPYACVGRKFILHRSDP